jgi:hypothetical protein
MEKGIKLASTTFRNFTKFNAIEVNYNDDISYLCGNNGAGKSSLTVLGLQACIKGIAEKDLGGNLIGSRFAFIGPIGKSADIGYRFHDQRHDRFFTITNHITQNQNDIKIEAEDGNQMPNEWLDDFLSVKLMSENHFCSLSSKDQALSLGINTMTFDDRISELKNTIAGLSRDLNKYSNTEPVERCTEINIDALQLERKAIVDEVNAKYLDNIKTNKELRAIELITINRQPLYKKRTKNLNMLLMHVMRHLYYFRVMVIPAMKFPTLLIYLNVPRLSPPLTKKNRSILKNFRQAL